MRRQLPNRSLLVGVAAVSVAALVGLGASAISPPNPPRGSGAQLVAAPQGSGGMDGMMGPGDMGQAASPQVTSARAVRGQIEAATHGAHVTSSARKITYLTKQVSLVMVGAPPGRPGMYWQADGLVNPTILVPAKSTITVHFADGDPGTHHGWELTATPPPYPRMAMMEAWPVVPGGFAMPVPPPAGSTWYGRTLKFVAPPAGTYHYLCPVPGHAQQGMWGTLVVE